MASERGTIHIDQALTNVSVGYGNTMYIADNVLPSVPVAKESDKYFIFGRENFRLDNDRRSDGVRSNRVISWTSSTSSYTCETHSLHDIVTERQRANADAPLQPDITTTKKLSDKLLLRREYDVSSYLFNTTTFSGYTTALSGTDQWSDYTNSTPLEDVDGYMTTIQKTIGIRPNTIVIGQEVFDKLKRHPDIVNIYRNVQPGLINASMLAEAFNVKRVLVGGASYNTEEEGATESLSYLWGKYCLIAYVTDSPALDSPSLGYTFDWKIYGGKVAKVKKWYEDGVDGTFIEVTRSYDVKMISTGAGYLLSTVVA